MDCKKVNDQLLFFLDNELSEKKKQEIELHLSACPDCQKKLDDLRNTQRILRQNFDSIKRRSAPLWTWMELEQRLATPIRGENLFSRMRTKLQDFVGCQPRWKLILVGILAMALITGSVEFIQQLMAPRPEAVASAIAINSPEVRALSGGEPSVEDSEVSDSTGYVLSQGVAGEASLAYVDLQQNTIMKIFRIPIPSLTDEDKSQSLAIAKADPSIQRILDSGATIIADEMFPLPPRLRLEVIGGQPVVWSEGTLVGVLLRLKSLTWVARINLGDGKVVKVSMVAPSSPAQTVQPTNIPYSKDEVEEITKIAESDTRVRMLLDKGAKVDHVALGCGEMANSGAMILKLGDEVWAAKVDLNSGTLTRVETVPQARPGRTNLFNLE